GYPLGATLEWNALGLTLFQPECAEAGCAGPGDRSGTFVWDGNVLKKWDDLRFVARSGDWTLLERLRAFGQEPRTAILRGPQGEKVLSAGHALSISANGETLVWIPGDRLVRFAADGRVIWQASFTGSVVKMLSPDAFIGAAPALAMFDVRRLIRIQLPTGSLVTGVPR
ncbi:MAG TPA: hypothetical protein VFQ66_01945, partial [Candidatus Limnocylindria bacterium]|nr:hypothetical protein [Candidatus Limnocylindria bacterium]